MRISDWSSDVCSSDLGLIIAAVGGWFLVGAFDYRIGTAVRMGPGYLPMVFGIITLVLGLAIMLLALGRAGKLPLPAPPACLADRKRVVEGKGVSVRVDLGGSRLLKKKKHIMT